MRGGGDVCGLGPGVLAYRGFIGDFFALQLGAQCGGEFLFVVDQFPDKPAS